MSILNIFMSPDVAFIGTDTDGVLADGSVVEGCKSITLPHLSAFVGFRGYSVTLMSLAAQIVGFMGNFDDLADHLAGMIEEARRVSQCQIDASEHPDYRLDGCDVVLVGYSLKLARLESHYFKVTADSRDVVHQSGFTWALMPYWEPERFPDPGPLRDEAALVRVAYEQMNRVVEREPASTPGGGRYYVTEVRKGSVSTRLALTFPPRTRHRRDALTGALSE